jgi:hypothetical protein
LIRSSKLDQHAANSHHIAAVLDAAHRDDLEDSFSKRDETNAAALSIQAKAAAFIGSNNLSFTLYPKLLHLIQDVLSQQDNNTKPLIGYNSDNDCAQFIKSMSDIRFRHLVDRVAASPYFSHLLNLMYLV